MTQAALAKAVKVSQAMIAQVERGNQDADPAARESHCRCAGMRAG